MGEVKSINQIQREQFSELIRRRHALVKVGTLGPIGAAGGFRLAWRGNSNPLLLCTRTGGPI